jgi:PAS domain S-box-containing protein
LALLREQEAAEAARREAQALNDGLRRESERTRESEARARDFARAASDWFWELDAELRTVFLSPNFEALMSVPIAERLGRPWRHGTHVEEDGERWVALDELMRRRQVVRDFTLPRRDGMGRVRTVRLSATPIYDAAGAFAGYRGASRDVTAEVASAAERDWLATIVDSSEDAIVGFDRAGRVATWNGGAERVYGWSAAEALGRPVEFLAPPEEAPSARAAVTRALAGEQVPARTGLRRRKDGSPIVMSISVFPLRSPDGRVVGCAGIGRNVTQVVRLEAALESLPQGVALFDSDDRLVFTNRAYRAWFEPMAANLKPGVDFEAYVRATAAAGELEEALGREEAWIAERLARHAAPGEPFELRLRGGRRLMMVEHRLPDGGVFITATDVTEARRKEDQLRQAQKLEAVGRLTGGVAHDFNNLLTVATGGLDMALDSPGLPPELRRLLEAAALACSRGAALTRRLLAFARQNPLEPRSTDLALLVEGMIELLRRTIGAQIEIVTELAPDLWRVEIDPDQLESALLNLAINARDAMPDGGRLALSAANEAGEDGDFVVLTVSDTGMGMPAEVAARAFEPFFTTKGEGKGSGLGLSMVYGFVAQSGGRIDLETAPGKGSVFMLRLPRAAAEAEPAAPEATSTQAGRSERILLVEDGDDVRELCSLMLDALGYSVTAERSGEAALARLEKGERFDLLLTDLMLPGGMSGAELLRRAREAAPGLRGLLMSGYIAEGMLGEHDAPVLAKPFDRERMARALNAALQAA